MGSALEMIAGFVRRGEPRHIVTADASMFVMAEKDPELRQIVAEADLVTPDSIGILWAGRRRGAPLTTRVSGVDIVERLCERSGECGWKLFFLGAAPGVASRAAEQMRARYPGAQIVGARDGYFQSDTEKSVIEEVRQARPDILCVAMGIPKQEKWIRRHRSALCVPVSIGVGGTFDVLSGSTRRAPAMFQRLYLEWLWRVLANPRKLSKVMLLPRFVLLNLRSNGAPLGAQR